MGLTKFTRFRTGEFIEFFNVEETGQARSERSDRGPWTEFRFKPGGFKEHIDISVVRDDTSGDITRGDLYLAREWVGNEVHLNMLSNDITKSFIHALVHENDTKEAEAYTGAIWRAHGTDDIVVQIVDDKTQAMTSPLASAMVEVYKGLKLCIDVKFSRCMVSLENESRDGRDRLHVHITAIE
nr:hypothetical protein [Candidatus Sigynarchaeota archaeon]